MLATEADGSELRSMTRSVFTAAMGCGLIAVPASGQAPIVGSQVPCTVPIKWTIDRIDARAVELVDYTGRAVDFGS